MTVVQSYWKEIGVTMNLSVEDSGVWSSDWADGNLEVTALGWYPLYADADNHMYTYFYSGNAAKKSSFYNNPEFDAKVDEARTTVDDKERVAKMQEADAMVAADCPVIPIMFYTHTIAGSDRIKHLYVDPQKHADLGTAELA